jgi:hypothetical protein
MITYRTKSLQESAVLLSQTEFAVNFKGLESTDQQNKFKFVFEVEAEQKTFDEWKWQYINRKLLIEPKEYDNSLNILRDSLTLHKT